MDSPPRLVQMLAHDIRWQIVHHLQHGDARVNELVTAIDKPMNAISYHLRILRDADFVLSRRSEADGRDIYYSLNIDEIARDYELLGSVLHLDMVLTEQDMSARILFLCTHNSARSIMAEALMCHYATDSITVMSAGSHPTAVHPDAITTLNRLGIPVDYLQSKHLSNMNREQFDYVITVCDYAREVCPTFGGETQLHWGFPDPSAIEDATDRREAFQRIAMRLQSRIIYFLQTLAKTMDT